MSSRSENLEGDNLPLPVNAVETVNKEDQINFWPRERRHGGLGLGHAIGGCTGCKHCSPEWLYPSYLFLIK